MAIHRDVPSHLTFCHPAQQDSGYHGRPKPDSYSPRRLVTRRLPLSISIQHRKVAASTDNRWLAPTRWEHEDSVNLPAPVWRVRAG